MHLSYRSENFWKAPWKSSCVSVSMTFVTASFISSIHWWPLTLDIHNPLWLSLKSLILSLLSFDYIYIYIHISPGVLANTQLIRPIIYIYIYIYIYIGLMSWLFANTPGDLGSIPVRVIPKTQKIAFDAALLNTQHYKVRIKSKKSREWSSVLPYTLGKEQLKRKPSGHPRLTSPTLLLTCLQKYMVHDRNKRS